MKNITLKPTHAAFAKIAILLIVHTFLLYCYFFINFLMSEGALSAASDDIKRFLMLLSYLLGDLILLLMIMRVFRFRFKAAENLNLSRHTVIIAAVCTVLLVVSLVFSRITTAPHIFVTFALYTIFFNSMFEELFYRGFIANSLFRLKPHGLKIPAAIVISSVVFGLLHIPWHIFENIYSDFDNTLFYVFQRFLGTAGFGLSWAIILYYKKDLLMLIILHATNNLLLYNRQSSENNTAATVIHLISIIVLFAGYPLFLIFQADRQIFNKFIKWIKGEQNEHKNQKAEQ